MAENQGDPSFGWTFQVSYQSIGEGPPVYVSPYHVGISDKSQAKAELENSLTPSEGMDIKLLSPISVSLARTLGLRPNEIKQE